ALPRGESMVCNLGRIVLATRASADRPRPVRRHSLRHLADGEIAPQPLARFKLACAQKRLAVTPLPPPQPAKGRLSLIDLDAHFFAAEPDLTPGRKPMLRLKRVGGIFRCLRAGRAFSAPAFHCDQTFLPASGRRRAISSSRRSKFSSSRRSSTRRHAWAAVVLSRPKWRATEARLTPYTTCEKYMAT